MSHYDNDEYLLKCTLEEMEKGETDRKTILAKCQVTLGLNNAEEESEEITH